MAYRESALGGVAAAVWSVHATTRHRTTYRALPDACVDITWTLDGDAVVRGPQTTWRDLPIEGDVRALGVRLRPAVASEVLGIPVDALTDRREPLADVLGRGAVLDGMDEQAWWRWVGRAVTRQRGWVGMDRVATAAAASLSQRRPPPVATVAEHLGLSERQLRRRFVRAVGVTPKTFARHCRLHRVLSDRLLSDPAARDGAGWAALAYEHGFADQAHLSREVRTLTGFPPTSLLDGCTAVSYRSA